MSNQVDDFISEVRDHPKYGPIRFVGLSFECEHRTHIHGCPGDCYTRPFPFIPPKESNMEQSGNFPLSPMQETARQFEVPGAIERLIRAVDNLQGVHNDLRGRLAPVMSSVDSTAKVVMEEAQQPEQAMMTETSDRINNCAISVEGEVRAVQEMLRRLEV